MPVSNILTLVMALPLKLRPPQWHIRLPNILEPKSVYDNYSKTSINASLVMGSVLGD